jgi:hypothetical protein
MFGTLRDALRGRNFTSDQKLREALYEWLVTQPKTFLSEGIEKLLDCWTKFVEMGGGYIVILIYILIVIVILNKKLILYTFSFTLVILKTQSVPCRKWKTES